MQAVIWTRYGGPEVLQLSEIEKPTPNNKQILVRVIAANVFPGDCELRRMDISFPFSLFVRPMIGFFKPRKGARLGQEYAGEVVAVGKDVLAFRPGDRIFGAIEPALPGCYAEYLVTAGKAAMKLPQGMSFEAASAASVGGLNALQILREAGVTEGAGSKRILLIGAGGSIGTMAIQMAKSFGSHVTVVDTTHKLAKLLELGADRAIDYTREDITSEGGIYDATIDIVGRNAKHNPLLRNLSTVKPGGRLILANPPFRHLLLRLCAPLFTRKTLRFALATYGRDECRQLLRLLESGKVTPTVDRRYSLEQTVEAHRYVDTGRRIGNVVLTVGQAR